MIREERVRWGYEERRRGEEERIRVGKLGITAK